MLQGLVILCSVCFIDEGQRGKNNAANYLGAKCIKIYFQVRAKILGVVVENRKKGQTMRRGAREVKASQKGRGETGEEGEKMHLILFILEKY